MTAPTEQEIRDLLTGVTQHGPDLLDATIPIEAVLNADFTEAAFRLENLYDVGDFRESEWDRFSELVRQAIDPIRKRAAKDLEAALMEAARTFAAEYPDAPRRAKEAVPAMTRPADPAVIEAIEAELAFSVYEARRLARLRLLGLEPPPLPRPKALQLRRIGSLRPVA